MSKKRRQFSSAFKARVAIEALRERETLAELSRKYDLHANVISGWKKAFLDNASLAFEKGSAKEPEGPDSDVLYQEIGKLRVENEFLKKTAKKLGL